jgi:Holliday junction resolvasome RuvABC endonuclease subunit
MVVLAVDPSVLNFGWACYNSDFEGRHRIMSDAWRFGCIHPKGADRVAKWNDTLFKLWFAIQDWPLLHFVAEWPVYFASERGRIAAQKGSTLELAGMVGYLAGRLCMRPDCVTLYTPTQWKGAVPKDATKAKFIRTFGAAARSVAATSPDDTVDAIMLAEHWLTTEYDCFRQKSEKAPRENAEVRDRTERYD